MASNGTMVRNALRGALGAGIAAAVLVVLAAPAAAKCGHGTGVPCPDPVHIEATIYDPSWGSTVIRGPDAWRMLNVTGVNYRPYRIYDEPPARLGPEYQVLYRITSGGRVWTVYQELYPHAAGRPFAFTRAGQRYVGRHQELVEAGHGWRGSRTLEDILRGHGLPDEAPVAESRSVPVVANTFQRGTSPPWWIGGVAALGVVALIPRLRRRSA